LEVSLIADSGLHNHFWTVDRTKRQDDFSVSVEMTTFSFIDNVDAGGSLTVESKPQDCSVRQNGKILSMHDWVNIGTKY
jgi:hypothetical protein